MYLKITYEFELQLLQKQYKHTIPTKSSYFSEKNLTICNFFRKHQNVLLEVKNRLSYIVM